MKKHTAIIGIIAASAIGLTACGSDGTTDHAGAFTPADAAAQATQAAAPTTDSGRMHKDIGEAAGFTNESGPVLTFTIDSITTDSECQGSGTKPGTPDGQFLKVDMTATSDSAMPIELSNALATSYWATVSTDGVTTTDIGTYECFNDESSRLSSIKSGNTYKVHAIFDVPTDAQALVFQADSSNAKGWEWSIPQ